MKRGVEEEGREEGRPSWEWAFEPKAWRVVARGSVSEEERRYVPDQVQAILESES